MKKICFCSTDWNDNPYRRLNNKYGGVAYYRLVKPMELLKDEYDVTFYGADIQKLSKGRSTDDFYRWLTWEYHMIIVKQIDNATASQALLHWGKQNNCLIVQDYDDDMLAVREDQPASKMGYQVGGQRRAYTASMMSLADALIVSTTPLKESFTQVLKEVFKDKKDIYVFPNYNDVNDWNYPQPKKDGKKIVIGWAGSVTHDADLKIVMPALAKILDKYDNVYLELLGGIMQGSIAFLTKDFSPKAKDKLRVIFGTPAWDKYPELMMSQKWDIGLAPLIDDKFNRSKSHIKWMEYAMIGIPTIASDVYPYSKNIKEGTGLLAGDWEKHLSFLIENPEERKRISENAFKYIKENLQWKQHKQEYFDIVRDIFEKNTDK